MLLKCLQIVSTGKRDISNSLALNNWSLEQGSSHNRCHFGEMFACSETIGIDKLPFRFFC